MTQRSPRCFACVLLLTACQPELVAWEPPADTGQATETDTAEADTGSQQDTGPASDEIDGDHDGFSPADGDCDDDDRWIHPGAQEWWYDGVDQDCAGDSDFDQDGDGWEAGGYGGEDCNDRVATVHPEGIELADGVDQDCDGVVDEGTQAYDDDGDGFSEDDGDCDDTDATLCPGCEEVTDDGIDQDCDGEDALGPVDLCGTLALEEHVTIYLMGMTIYDGTVDTEGVAALTFAYDGTLSGTLTVDLALDYYGLGEVDLEVSGVHGDGLASGASSDASVNFDGTLDEAWHLDASVVGTPFDASTGGDLNVTLAGTLVADPCEIAQ